MIIVHDYYRLYRLLLYTTFKKTLWSIFVGLQLFSSAVIIKKLNDFSSIGDHAYHIEEYKEKRITPQTTISVIKV